MKDQLKERPHCTRLQHGLDERNSLGNESVGVATLRANAQSDVMSHGILLSVSGLDCMELLTRGFEMDSGKKMDLQLCNHAPAPLGKLLHFTSHLNVGHSIDDCVRLGQQMGVRFDDKDCNLKLQRNCNRKTLAGEIGHSKRVDIRWWNARWQCCWECDG